MLNISHKLYEKSFNLIGNLSCLFEISFFFFLFQHFDVEPFKTKLLESTTKFILHEKKKIQWTSDEDRNSIKLKLHLKKHRYRRFNIQFIISNIFADVIDLCKLPLSCYRKQPRSNRGYWAKQLRISQIKTITFIACNSSAHGNRRLFTCFLVITTSTSYDLFIFSVIKKSVKKLKNNFTWSLIHCFVFLLHDQLW
jgi:hypothetical protein